MNQKQYLINIYMRQTNERSNQYSINITKNIDYDNKVKE